MEDSFSVCHHHSSKGRSWLEGRCWLEGLAWRMRPTWWTGPAWWTKLAFRFFDKGNFSPHHPPIKWRIEPLKSCSKSAIVPRDILLNHTLTAPFCVVGDTLHITSFGVIWNSINVLNDSMWSNRSLEPSYDSYYGRQNFSGRGRLSTSVVNGEPVLQIILSKFSSPLSFMAYFNSSISFLMLRSSFSILEESSPEVLSRLLAWEFDSSFSFSPVRQCYAFWDFIFFRSSSFWQVSSSTLAKRAWICCCCIASSCWAVSGCCSVFGSISYFEELFCHWKRWLEWLTFPTDRAKLMMQKISNWALRHNEWTKLWVRSSLLKESLENELAGRVTRRCGVSQTASDA